jgi:hypothetical protein
MPNRLSRETSPYLLQHQDNPVDWYPWGPEALERARREDRPILLSIGYSACHWCHVMAHESFEDEAIAALMNERFVNIKVDREERPDLDQLYMNAVQALTGHGGWPMTMFLLPDGRPFFGGTYFPPRDAYGRPGFPTVLSHVSKAFHERRADLEQNAATLTAHLGQVLKGGEGPVTERLLDSAADHLLRQFDSRWGGFGGAPKFPPAMSLEFLMRHFLRRHDEQDRHIVRFTLRKMAQGGMYDQLGGGFHRYSVDGEWLVPHFEKMLYDNALLSRLYLLAHQAYGEADFRRVAEETYDWVLRDMTSPEGAFYSALDADSEGEEGRYYVWSAEEIDRELGPEEAGWFKAAYGVTSEGNFEGHSVLFQPRPLAESISEVEERRFNEARRRLLARRYQRVAPGCDDKVVTAWNGLMLRSFAEASRLWERDDYRTVAIRNAEFLLGTMREGDRLLRTARRGVAKLNGYLEDYANVIDGLLTLFEATFETRWLKEAETLAETMVHEFWDEALPGFYDTGRSHETLIARPRELFDNATPAGNSVACDVLLRLARYLGRTDWSNLVAQALGQVAQLVGRFPNGFGRLLGVIDASLAPSREVAIVGALDQSATQAMVRAAFADYSPHRLVAAGTDGPTNPVVFLRDRPAPGPEPVSYLCVAETCSLPITDPRALAAAIREGES